MGVVVLFLASLFVAIGEPTGTPGNIRLLQFLSPADLAVAAILVLSVALVALVVPPDGRADAGIPPTTVRLVVGCVAAAVATAALVRAVVALTVAHQRGVAKFGNMIDALAALLVAAAAALWALQGRPRAG